MTDLRHLLAIYVHAHETGNPVPPYIESEARAVLLHQLAQPAPVTPPADDHFLQAWFNARAEALDHADELADAMESDADSPELEGLEEITGDELMSAADIIRRYVVFKEMTGGNSND